MMFKTIVRNSAIALLAGFAGFGAISCSSEDDVPIRQETDGARFYSSIRLSLPTKSETVDPSDPGSSNSSNGLEYGQDYENHIGSIIVVFAKKDAASGDYKFEASSLASTALGDPASDPMKTVDYRVEFKKNELVNLASHTVGIFAICNPTEGIIKKVNALKSGDSLLELEEAVTDKDDATIWKSNNFLMTNAYISEKEFDGIEELEKHDTPENPYNIGTVYVERVASRLDIRQVTPDGSTTPNVYPIKNAKNEVMGNVTLDGVALVNMANTYFVFPRVASTAEASFKQELCGVETPLNWVVSPNWNNFFSTKPESAPAFSFYYAGPADVKNYTFIDFTKLNKDDDEGDNSTWPGLTTPSSDYKIWRYITENTIPGSDNQTRGITTSLVFRAVISMTDAAISKQMEDGNVIYEFNGTIYGNKETLVKAAEKNTELQLKVNEAFTEDNMDANGDLIKAVTSGNGSSIKIFRPTKVDNKNVYYCYYWYGIRHNDNRKPGEMGPMEFGVVRNNIYKLAVTKIREFGHTGDPGDDPDPVDPDDPDEDPKVYFDLDVKLVRWIVRVNNIEF